MSQLVEKGRRPVHLGVMVREEQRRALAELAREQDRSVSSVVRAAVSTYLERKDREKGAAA
jgi:predicted transcriptional regulator